MLRRYRYDELHILPVQDVQVQSDFYFDEEPKVILACEVKQLKNKQVPLVKVLWKHHGMEKETREPESIMKFFNSGMNFEDKILLRRREL